MDVGSLAQLGLLVAGVTIAASSFAVEGQTIPKGLADLRRFIAGWLFANGS